jgi:hypothetical protein
MENSYRLVYSKELTKKALIDFVILAFIYYVPAISHLLSFPLYLLDPMRMMVIVSIVFTSRKNTFLIALTLPIMSFILSNHPYFIKAVLICTELTFNVWLFYKLTKVFKSYFLPMLLSILTAKIYYYCIKYLLVRFALINSSLVSTPIYFQIGVALFLSSLIQIIFYKTIKFTETGETIKRQF